MNVLVLGIFVFMAMGLVVVAIILQNKQSQYQKYTYDRSELNEIDNTQDLIPFEDIKQNRVMLGDNRYAAYIKVKPFNYLINSEGGKNAFAQQLRNMFNNWDFRFNIYTHTRPMVNKAMLERLSDTIQETLHETPQLRKYAEEYYKQMSVINLNDPATGALRTIKEYYIIVYWDPTPQYNPENTSQAKLNEVAAQELYRRVSRVIEGLSSASVGAELMYTQDIIELLLSIYHREETNMSRQVYSGEYHSPMVRGDRHTLSISDTEKLQAIVEGAMNSIDVNIITRNDINGTAKHRGKLVHQAISKLNNKLKSMDG